MLAFTRYRVLNRLALRTKLDITQPKYSSALVYLKHDAMGPHGDAALMVFNPGKAQNITVDLSLLPEALLQGSVVPYDILKLNSTGPQEVIKE